MHDSEDPESMTWEDFQEDFQCLRSLFDGLEHVLIHQYSVKPGNWQRNFHTFGKFFDHVTDRALYQIRKQQDMSNLYLEHIEMTEGARALKASIREAIKDSSS